MPHVTTGPLSFQQEEMLRRLRDFPSCAARYDLVWAFELDGPLQLEHLTAAVEDVVARHAVLRTTIEAVSHGDVQRVHDRQLVPTRLVESTAAEAFLAELVAQRLTTDQVLDGASLFSAAILQQSPRRHLLVVKIHHLLCDSLSLFALWHDLGACYRARVEKCDPVLSHLAMSYTDYAIRQRAAWPSMSGDAIDFWRTLSAGAPRATPWADTTMVDDARFDTETASVAVSGEVVRRAASAARVTPFLVLLAATATSMARVAGRDILVGTDIANREDPLKQGMVGHLLNSRLTRAAPSDAVPLLDLVRRTRESWLDADDYRDVYLDQVLQHLGIEWLPLVLADPGDASTQPVFKDIVVRRVDVARRDRHWRELLVTWRLDDPGRPVAEILYRRACLDSAASEALATGIEQVLANS